MTTNGLQYDWTSLDAALGETEEQRRERIEAMKRRLQKIAREMLDEDKVREGPGVAFVDVRFAAETRGLLTGEEQGRTLSFGSTLMEAAGGEPFGWKRSKHRNSNRRLVRTFKLPPFDLPEEPR
jgi:hypothetical protein